MGIIGSTDPEINKIRFRSSPYIFQNSECIFIEYLDCLQLPWLVFLMSFRNNERLDKIFDLKSIRYLTDADIINYYFNRPYRNPLAGLLKRDKDKRIPFEELDEIVMDGIKDLKEAFLVEADTLITPMIQNLVAMKLTKNIMVYCPFYSEYVENDIKGKLGDMASIVTGDIKEAINQTPKDTTYFFSDVNHIIVLEETGKLDYSAIMVPSDYRYNFVDDEKSIYNVDMKYMAENHVFKWAKYRVI